MPHSRCGLVFAVARQSKPKQVVQWTYNENAMGYLQLTNLRVCISQSLLKKKPAHYVQAFFIFHNLIQVKEILGRTSAEDFYFNLSFRLIRFVNILEARIGVYSMPVGGHLAENVSDFLRCFRTVTLHPVIDYFQRQMLLYPYESCFPILQSSGSL